MAARKTAKTVAPVVTEETTVNGTDLLVQLFVILESFESTEDEPTATVTIADELNRQNETALTATEVYALLETLAETNAVDAIRGEWFINVPDVNEGNAEDIARKFISEGPTMPVKAPEKPVGSQTGLTRTQIAEELPSVALDVIGEHAVGMFPPVIEDWHNAEYEPTIPEFAGPDRLPVPPVGVNHNTWELAHVADTATGRKFWRDRVAAQLAEYDALNANDHLMANMGC